MHRASKRAINGLILCGLALFGAAATGGCQSYLEDSTERTVGEITDDASIQWMVKTRLVGDPDVRGRRINVDVNKGVVTLMGRVRSDEERARAGRIAAAVPHVVRVVDRLEVRD